MEDLTETRGKGQPTKYKTEFNELAFNYCLMGAVDADLARFFSVAESTINNWKNEHPDFLESIKNGKDQADAKVAASLFGRANGVVLPDTDIRTIYNQETKKHELLKTPIEKHIPGDVTAQIFWLKNRQPQLWRDSQYIDQTNRNKVAPAEIDLSQLTEDELETLIELQSKIGISQT